MDEFLNAISALVQYVEQNGASLSPELQAEIATILQDVSELMNPPIEANLPTSAGMLWYIAGGKPQVFSDYLRQVPDQELNAIAANPFTLQTAIQRLSENQPQQRNRESDGIPQAPIQSSNIYGFQYDPNDQKLFVKFQGDGVYQYKGVPPQIFEIFRSGAVPAKTSGQNDYGRWWEGKSPSLGAAFFEMIRNRGFPYQKVA